GPRVLVLPLRAPAGLARLLHDQQDPASDAYHRWLTPAEFGARFGAPEPEYEAAASWLSSHGFTVRRWANRTAIGFAGTAGQVERAFGVPLHDHAWHGRQFHAPSRAPLLRTFGETRGRAAVALDPFGQPHPLLRIGGRDALAPADLHAVFGLRELFAQGITGRGSAIAVVAVSDFATEDVAQFRATFGLPPATVTKRFV